MKSKSVIASLMAVVLTLPLALAVPDAFAKGGGRGGGGGRGHQFHGSQVHRGFHHHHRHHDRFFFSFGAVIPWGWYDPYYYWRPSPYYTYYGYPYPDYYGYPYYPYYRPDPCLSSDPAYAPYCPPTTYNPSQGYDVPPVDYPSPAPTEGESQPLTPPQ